MLAILLAEICFVSILFASDATQRIYTRDSDEYRKVVFLCQIGGVRYPTVTPTTAGELVKALERIPTGIVDKEREELINALLGRDAIYVSDTTNLDIDVYGGFDVLIHGDIDTYEYFVPYKDLDPMIAAQLKVSFASTADLYIEFMEKDPMLSLTDSMEHWTNFIAIASVDDGTFNVFNHLTQAYQPFKVGISVGNNWFNFQLARNRQSFGDGVTGNLVISDNFSYEEYIRATFTSEIFSYYLDVTHFDQQLDSLTFASFSLSGNHQLRAIHRFEITPLDTLMLSVSFGSMFQSDSMFDWRMLVPMMIVHSFNNFSEDGSITDGDEANNIMAFDISWSFMPGWLMHFEAVMDQFQVPTYERDNFMPNAFGFLLNFQNTSIISEGILHSYIEAVYTMPYLYLNRMKVGDDGVDYNYDWILGHKITGGSEIQYSGYPEGPDTFKLAIGSDYAFPFRLTLGLDAEFMIHGVHGINFSGNSIDTVNEDWRDEENIMEYTLAFTISIGYIFDFGLSLGIDIYLPYKWNYNNVLGENAFIPQAFAYIRYSFL